MHAKSSLKEVTYQCYVCDKHLDTKTELSRHIETMHKGLDTTVHPDQSKIYKLHSVSKINHGKDKNRGYC